MKFVSYSKGGGEIRAGLSVDGKIIDLAEGAAGLGSSLPASVVEILALGDAGMETAKEVETLPPAAKIPTIAEADATLHAAVQIRRPFFCLPGTTRRTSWRAAGRRSTKTRSIRARSSNRPRRSSAPAIRS